MFFLSFNETRSRLFTSSSCFCRLQDALRVLISPILLYSLCAPYYLFLIVSLSFFVFFYILRHLHSLTCKSSYFVAQINLASLPFFFILVYLYSLSKLLFVSKFLLLYLCLVSIKFSKPCFFIMCLRNFSFWL